MIAAVKKGEQAADGDDTGPAAESGARAQPLALGLQLAAGEGQLSADQLGDVGRQPSHQLACGRGLDIGPLGPGSGCTAG